MSLLILSIAFGSNLGGGTTQFTTFKPQYYHNEWTTLVQYLEPTI